MRDCGMICIIQTGFHPPIPWIRLSSTPDGTIKLDKSVYTVGLPVIKNPVEASDQTETLPTPRHLVPGNRSGEAAFHVWTLLPDAAG